MSSNSGAVPPCDSGVRYWGGRRRFILKHVCIAHAFKQHTCPSALKYCHLCLLKRHSWIQPRRKRPWAFCFVKPGRRCILMVSEGQDQKRAPASLVRGLRGNQTQRSPTGSEPKKEFGLGFLFTCFWVDQKHVRSLQQHSLVQVIFHEM